MNQFPIDASVLAPQIFAYILSLLFLHLVGLVKITLLNEWTPFKKKPLESNTVSQGKPPQVGLTPVMTMSKDQIALSLRSLHKASVNLRSFLTLPSVFPSSATLSTLRTRGYNPETLAALSNGLHFFRSDDSDTYSGYTLILNSAVIGKLIGSRDIRITLDDYHNKIFILTDESSWGVLPLPVQLLIYPLLEASMKLHELELQEASRKQAKIPGAELSKYFQLKRILNE